MKRSHTEADVQKFREKLGELGFDSQKKLARWFIF